MPEVRRFALCGRGCDDGPGLLELTLKILSDFKDYYDGGRALDTEDTPVYARFSRVHDLPPQQLSAAQREMLENAGRDLWQPTMIPPFSPVAQIEVIAFCGRLFPYYVLRWTNDKKKWTCRYCYTLDQYFRALEEYVAHEKTIENSDALSALRDALAEARGNDRQQRHRWGGVSLNTATWPAFQSRLVVDVPVRFFVYFKAPVVLFRPGTIRGTERRIIINPCLKEANFVSQVSPHQAWQDLSMYLGNTLVDIASKPPQPISDELRAETHGFDRQSFRSAKGGRIKSNRGDW